MGRTLKFVLVIALFAFSMSTPSAYAQSGSESTKASGPRKQVATIVFAGLAGAILGLSTLSFYGRPQDKLNNIGIGAAVGVFAGAGYTIFQAATKPKDFYGFEPEAESKLMAYRTMGAPVQYTPKMVYNWSF